MKKKMRGIIWIFIGFMIIIFTAFITFQHMNTRIKEINQDTVQEVGFTYLSALTAETINHSHTYFSSKFDSIDQILDTTSSMDLSLQEAKDYISHEIESGAIYISLLTKDGQFETLRGDETFRPYDKPMFDKNIEAREDRVILAINDDNERIVALVKMRDFTLGGKEYSAMICGIHPETLNVVLNLFYNKAMVYSFVVRRGDSAFVVRNEDSVSKDYFERIKNFYEEYNGMTPDDYISQIGSAMEKFDTYNQTFMIDGDLRLMYARPFSYSDWYLVTFMRYSEINQLMDINNEKTGRVFNNSFILLFIVFLIIFISYAVFSYLQIKKQNELRTLAVSANQAKSEFLSNMSHDIRTPMNIIIGMTDIATNNIDDKKRVEECLSKIMRSSRHLLSLINDVLDMSKIESNKMTLSMVQISFRESFENVVMMIQPQVNAKQQNFDVYINNIISENVYCDSLRINQVLINLLSNAVKYTQREGTISLTLMQEESPKGDMFVRNHIYVKDNGIGMSEEFVKKIFDSFVREDRKRVTREEGTGLGMTITKHIIDMMDGTIEVKSQQDVGSEFHVILDLRKGDTDMGNMNLNGLKVLIADDDSDLCGMTVQALKEIGADPESVSSGREAVKIIEENPDKYDVVLVDCHMPELNGVETARRIKNMAHSKAPVILVSGYDLGEVESEARQAGINGFILKPLFKSTLYFGIKNYIENKSAIEENKNDAFGFDGGIILLAEDNELNSEVATEILNEAGFEVDWAENGKICVEKFQYSEINHYCAILMDIRMPVMDGYEATKNIRSMTGRADSDIPIIAMTADAFAEDVAKAISSGMNAHIAKPIDTNALFCILRQSTRNHSSVIQNIKEIKDLNK